MRSPLQKLFLLISIVIGIPVAIIVGVCLYIAFIAYTSYGANSLEDLKNQVNQDEIYRDELVHAYANCTNDSFHLAGNENKSQWWTKDWQIFDLEKLVKECIKEGRLN